MKQQPTILYDHESGSRLYTVKAAAAYLGYHRHSVYRLLLQGDLRPHRQAGKTYLFLKEDLDRYRHSNAWAARKAALQPLPTPPPRPPDLTARVWVNFGFDLLSKEVDVIRPFTWEQIPLIHARVQDVYGSRPSKIEISGPDGGSWSVTYEPPTWLSSVMGTLKRRSG
jgi:excisionase family DNA binding protein